MYMYMYGYELKFIIVLLLLLESCCSVRTTDVLFPNKSHRMDQIRSLRFFDEEQQISTGSVHALSLS